MSKRATSSEDNVNGDICSFLIELADYEKSVNNNIHKYNAYRKAASTLAAHPTRVHSGKEAKHLKGIGTSISEKIDEFLLTGEVTKLKKIRDDDASVAITLLTRVSGIGPAKARELVEDGITTLEQLRTNTDKLTHHQVIGLKYFHDFEQKIPREEIKAIEEALRTEINTLDNKFELTICGSYRRGKEESGDIDVLLTHPEYTSKDTKLSNNFLENVVNTLKVRDLIIDTISLGHVKFMGVCKLREVARRLDIRLTPNDQFYCAVLYFTGSDLFNQEMRAHAMENGFTLNEYCLRVIGSTGVPGEPLPVTSEKDIFDYISYPYKEPGERNL